MSNGTQLYGTDLFADQPSDSRINFRVEGKIVQWQRVKSRYNPVTKRIISNNNPDMVQYQNLIVLSYSNACGGVPKYFGDKAPIHIEVKAFFQLPKSAPKKIVRLVDSGALVRRLRTPDCDNIAKNVNDALNKIAYADDKQVSIGAIDFWTTGTEHIEVLIYQENYYAW